MNTAKALNLAYNRLLQERKVMRQIPKNRRTKKIRQEYLRLKIAEEVIVETAREWEIHLIKTKDVPALTIEVIDELEEIYNQLASTALLELERFEKRIQELEKRR